MRSTQCNIPFPAIICCFEKSDIENRPILHSPYGKYLKKIGYSMPLYDASSGQVLNKHAANAYDSLIESINNVYEDVILGTGTIDSKTHPDEYHLYNNPFHVVDGPCYAFVVHGKGPAVGGQGEIFNDSDDSKTARYGHM